MALSNMAPTRQFPSKLGLCLANPLFHMPPCMIINSLEKRYHLFPKYPVILLVRTQYDSVKMVKLYLKKKKIFSNKKLFLPCKKDNEVGNWNHTEFYMLLTGTMIKYLVKCFSQLKFLLMLWQKTIGLRANTKL